MHSIATIPPSTIMAAADGVVTAEAGEFDNDETLNKDMLAWHFGPWSSLSGKY